MILDPISIATKGYVGITQTHEFCPLPLAIASLGYIRFIHIEKGGGSSTAYNAHRVKEDNEVILAVIIATTEEFIH